MPRRPLLTLVVVALLSTTGCSDTIGLERPVVSTSLRKACAALLADAPSTVGGQPRRAVAPSDAGRAWGDPAITLQCGLARPTSLTLTTPCAYIDGVGWLRESDGGTDVFTTIGRAAYVRVRVPDRYDPTADALVDLAGVVKEHDPLVQDCV